MRVRRLGGFAEARAQAAPKPEGSPQVRLPVLREQDDVREVVQQVRLPVARRLEGGRKPEAAPERVQELRRTDEVRHVLHLLPVPSEGGDGGDNDVRAEEFRDVSKNCPAGGLWTSAGLAEIN